MPVKRKHFLFSNILITLVLASILGIILWYSYSFILPKTVHLTLLHTNDTHGHLLPFEYKDKNDVGGIARLATIVDNIRKETGINVLLLSAGDVFQGTPMSSVFKGKADFEAMNAIGYDAMVPGNHEFDFGQSVLLSLAKEAKFPVISCNILSKASGKTLLKPYLIKEIDGMNVVILGVTTTETSVTTHPNNVRGLVFEDPVASVKKTISSLGTEPDFLIVLSHCGYDYDLLLAKKLPQINIIIGGHSHTKVEKPVFVGTTAVTQAYQWGEFLGRIDIKVSDNRKGKFKVKEISGSLIPVDSSVAPSPLVDAIVNKYENKLDKQMKAVIGSSESFLDNAGSKQKQTAIGDFISGIMLSASKADIAFENGGGIRSFIKKGPVTVGDIYTVLPFDNFLLTMELTGRQIRDILEQSAASNERFLQFSGLNAVIKDKKVISISIKGARLDLKKLYTVATNDFLAAGGDGYDIFKLGKNVKNTGLYLRDIVIDYIKKAKTIK